jgi:hypothetical protein
MPWTDDDLTRALGELRKSPVPERALAEVRARVLEQVEAPRRRWLWWLAPVPLAAVLALMLLPKSADIPPPPVLGRAPGPAPFMHQRPAARPALKAPRFIPTAQDGLIRLASTRKDIVIYWDLTPQGEAQ